jgi:periplasmic protein TonB
VKPTQVQAEMMNDQLTAPTQIPQGIKRQVADDAPPSAGFATAGAGGLGGNGAIGSVFNGQAKPIVKPSKPITISAGVATGLLIQGNPAIYPPIAKSARVSGTVELEVTISKIGTIKDLHVVSGPVMLRQAAVDAVRTWRYKPYRLNNKPIESQSTIYVAFSLGG